MLETVREFAAEELAAQGDDDAARRHAAFFLALAARAEQTYWGDAPGAARDALIPELANLRVALAWAARHDQPDMALQLARAMFDLYWMFDPLWRTSDNARDLRAWTRRALAMPGGSDRNRVTALIGAATLAEAHDDVAGARTLLDDLCRTRRLPAGRCLQTRDRDLHLREQIERIDLP
jgi:predicted ATPase